MRGSVSGIPFTSIVRGLPATVPFTGPETLERRRGCVFRARIGANESAFGVSPMALEAMGRELARAAWYGDPEALELREALAEHHGVAVDELVVGAGVDELLGVVVRMLVEPGASVVTSLGAYPTFNYHVVGHGGVLRTVPYVGDQEDPDALLEAAEDVHAPLVYFANPDNPMGSWHDASVIERMIERLPEDRVLVLDEAYSDFVGEETLPPIRTDDPRVIRMRTFSKAHGMAGLRIGYAIGHRDLITGISKIRNHFGVNRIAQAGAMASLADRAFQDGVRRRVEAGKRHYGEIAARLGMMALPSATNFVAIDVGGAKRARALLAGLQEEGVFVRMPGVAPLDRCIRVTVGTEADRAIFETAITSLVEREAGHGL